MSAGPACPICETRAAPQPAFVADVPVLLNVVVHDAEAARGAERGSLALRQCEACGLCWNSAFAGVPYDARYQIDPTLSPRFREHLDRVVARLAALAPETSALRVVDVGAGQGRFLEHLAQRLGPRLVHAHGFDPAFRGEPLPSPIALTPAILSEASATALPFAPNVVVTRHVIEHVADPIAFLASIPRALGPEASFSLVVETPNVGHTLARGLLHDFAYEHCSLLSDAALAEALHRAGYDAIDVRDDAFGGEYLLASARWSPGATARAARALPPRADRSLAALAARFAAEHRERLEASRGPIALWGGAGKGALFALLTDPDRARIDAVVDIHPAKQGSYLPGAGHRVVGPDEARALGVRTVVVANGTYAAEIAAQCRASAIAAELWTVGDAQAG